MGCNCKLTEIIIGVVIIVFTWWQIGASISQWIVTIVVALLILRALKCENCGVKVSSIKKKRGK